MDANQNHTPLNLTAEVYEKPEITIIEMELESNVLLVGSL